MKNKCIKNIIIYLGIAMFVGGAIIQNIVTDYDELWNFNFANCIAKGLIPYKDFNMVTTPLLSIICGGVLKIFGQELYVMRILAVILDTTIIFLIYKLMSKLEIKKSLIYITIIVVCSIMKDYFAIDYNYAVLLVALIIIYLEINWSNNKTLLEFNFKKDILLGILGGICITLKQSTGVLIFACLTFYKILEIRKKDDIKIYIKIVCSRILGAIIPVAIMLLYLFINNAIPDFIDYSILGISTFANKMSYINLIKDDNILVKILSFFPLFSIILIIDYIKNKDKKSLILLVYGIVEFTVVYPISDKYHFIIGIIPLLIGTIYLANKIKIHDNIYIQVIFEVIIIMAVIISFSNGIQNYLNLNKNYELEHFTGMPMDEDAIADVKQIIKYVNDNENVYILDPYACIYSIANNRYYKDYDMFLIGNIGKDGEDGQIEKLKNMENKKILIKNENYKRNWQNPENVRKWIINNMTKTGEIGSFDIYE